MPASGSSSKPAVRLQLRESAQALSRLVLREVSLQVLYRRALLLVVPLLLFCCCLSSFAADPARNLPPRYRHWLTQEVNYIIGSDERKQFLMLASDGERDNFIQAFWDVRNPDPGAATNAFKEEHYRRLEYVNHTFGSRVTDDGWRTDRGRIYITLGPPKQRAEYLSAKNVHELAIWFYETTTPALPPHFYIVFYKRTPADEFRLYSPYQDGPVRLVATLEAMNDQKKSLSILQKSLGNEVARISLSLLPSEPTNLDDYSPSLESDVLLSTIAGLPDNPLTQELRAERRSRERVTSSVFLERNQTELQLATFRDAHGQPLVQYLLHYRAPDDTLVGALPGGASGYSMTMQTSVLAADGSPLFQDDQKLGGKLSDEQMLLARRKRFGAEGTLPLAPGEYDVVTTLTNDLTHVAVRQKRHVAVPNPAASRLHVTELAAFSAHPPERQVGSVPPFTFGGIRFAPQGAESFVLRAGEPLRLLFQIWVRPADLPAIKTGKMQIHYILGRLQESAAERHEFDQDVDISDFDANGTLLTGYTLSTNGVVPGNYRLVVSVVDPNTHEHAYSSALVRIAQENEITETWTAYDASVAGARSSAVEDYKRGLSARGSRDNAAAVAWFQRALAEDPSYEQALTLLVNTYAAAARFQEIAALCKDRKVSGSLDPNTVLLVADADIKAGDPKLAVKWLNEALQQQPPTKLFYRALADAYQASGDASSARNALRQAAEL